MKFTAEINVMPQKALLDPQGKAVCQVLQKTGHKGVTSVRIGKHIQIEIEAETEDKAGKAIDEVCSKVLINPIMENYTFKIKKQD